MSKSEETHPRPIPPPPVTQEMPKNIPHVEAPLPNIPSADSAPKDEDYKGVYTNSADGEPYALAVVDGAPDDKTHFAKNTAHFWNGTKSEFKAQFEKA